MTVHAVAPFILTNCKVKFGTTDEFQKAVSKAELVPTTPVTRFKGLGGNSELISGTPTWMLNIDNAQDWSTSGSLSSYLESNAGTVKACTLEPQLGEDGWTFDVLIVDGTIGGSVDALATNTVSLEVVGQPVRVPAV